MREQKANDNGFPVVGKQVKEQQTFSFDQLVQYNGATNTITVNANLDIQGEVKQENAIVFENVDLSNGSTQKDNTGANWAIMSDPSADVILQLYLTEQAVYPIGDVVELARISTSDDEVVFGGNFDYGNGDGYINYTITARCNADTVVISITETEANKGNVAGDAPYLSDWTFGGETYRVFTEDDINPQNAPAGYVLVSDGNYGYEFASISGSPKGVYDTLSDLEIAYPTGAEGIYIVSADGHWYYWNGSAWTDGGEYLSTSGSLGIKNFLNEYYITPLTDLDNAPDNSLFVISDNNACNIANKPQYFRINDHTSTCLFYSYLTSYSGETKVKTQVYKSLDDNVLFYRNKIGTNAWSAWKQDGLQYQNYFVNSGNYTLVLTDLNNAQINSTYVISLNGITISNLPSNLSSSENVVLQTITSYYNSTTQVLYQYLYSRTSPDVMYARIKIGANAWGSWAKLSKTNIFINYYSYAADLTDLNNAKKDIVYYLSGLESYYSNVSNLPSGVNTGNAILQTYSMVYQGNTECLVQTLVSITTGKTFSRNKIGANAWGAWTQWGISPNGRNKIVIGSSATADYNNLISGFQAAANQGNCDVYIEDGTYDLSNDIATIGTGLVLGKNNKYFFSSNSKVVCNYTGDNETVLTENSIFKSNMNDGDFELHNLTAEASRIRYIVHDENGSEATQHISRHVYHGCKFTFDNTNNPYKDTYFHCIGGGLGSATEIVIDSCIFNSVYVPNGKADAQYHGNWSNSEQAQAGKSNLIVKNSYFAHTFSISSPNFETQKKQLIFSGNSVAYDLYYNNTSDTNWEVYKWNNEIRGS